MVGEENLDSLKDVKKNILDDLKTGKFYNAEREDAAIGAFAESMGMTGFDFDDEDFDFDDDNKEESSSESSESSEITGAIHGLGNQLSYHQLITSEAVAGKIVELSEREQDMIIVQMDDDDFINIKLFIDKLSDVLKIPSLKVDNVVDKWMFLFGVNTVFGLEYFPALSAMLTDAYVGAYINNQKTIEKVVGNTLVQYTKAVLNKGESIVS